VEAGISSKETLYRYYAGKEELFVDVLSQMTLAQPGFSARLTALPAPCNLPSLRQALTILAREILSLMSQPEYLALVRIIIAETPRFPQLGPLFFSTVPQHGISIVMDLLREARERQVIAADVDFETVARALLGGLLTYAITGVMLAGEEAQPPALDRADALVEVMMRALLPR
jgi:AcrR family transcriptional regulator